MAKKKLKPKRYTITLTFTEEEAREIVNAVGMKKTTGNFYPEGDICDRALYSIAHTFHNQLFKKAH